MQNYFAGKRALVVINPVSGRNKTKEQLYDITALFSQTGLEITVYTTTGQGDAADIVRRRGASYDFIVCRGGDGTFHEVLNGVMPFTQRPPLGYIPSGSTNDLAKTLGIPTDTQEALDIIINSQPLWFDVGLFSGSAYWAYTASFGAFSEISYATPQRVKNIFGHAAYFSQIGHAFKAMHPIHMHVKTEEGFETEGDFAFGAVCNTNSIAGMLRLPRKLVGVNDGVYELLLVEYPASFSDLLGKFSGAMRHKWGENGVLFLRTKKVTFTFAEEVPWTLDGEYNPGEKIVTVENLHNAVRIFRR
jgi:YegS/Rv2252/BmrU family lipid kinase